MRATIIDKYGTPDELKFVGDFPKPRKNDQQLLIRVKASSINPIDWKIRKGDLKWIMPRKFPKILGLDISGTVEEVGNNVKNFKVGDEVYGMLDIYQGGGYAEFAAISGMSLCHKPKNLSFEEAAAVPLASLTALQSLRDKGNIKAGDAVLIIGAGGGVGTFAIQIAKAFGATVTAVAGPGKESTCKSLGADQFIDYTKVNVANMKSQFDIILNIAGKGSYFALRHLSKSGGRYVDLLPSMKGLFLSVLTKVLPIPAYRLIMAKSDKKDLELLKEMIEEGKIKPIIEDVYSLENIAEAHSHSEKYHSKGKLVIKI